VTLKSTRLLAAKGESEVGMRTFPCLFPHLEISSDMFAWPARIEDHVVMVLPKALENEGYYDRGKIAPLILGAIRLTHHCIIGVSRCAGVCAQISRATTHPSKRCCRVFDLLVIKEVGCRV
jgi:hypothetical protein